MLVLGLFLRPALAYFGIRGLSAIGSVVMVIALILASFCTEAWQLLLTQGMLFGLGSGMVYYPAIALLSQYFTRRKSLAMGVATSGSGIGGLVLAPLVRALIDRVEYQWTLRILAAMYVVLLSVVVLVSKERISIRNILREQKALQAAQPPDKGGWWMPIVRLFNLNLARRQDVQLMLAVSILTSFAYITPFYFLPAYVLHIGYSRTDAAVAVSVLSALNAFGRIAFGQLGVMFGSINMFLMATFLAGISCVLVWPLATNFPTVLVFAVLCGMTSGGYLSLYTSVTSNCSTLQDLSDTLGLVFSVSMFGNFFGPMLFGVLLNASGGEYLSGQLFVAAFYFVGSGCIARLRLLKSQSWSAVI
jgi:MFS family permease